MKFVTGIFCLMLFAQCSAPLKIIHYPPPQNEVYINSTLKQFLKAHPAPKIVLRISTVVAGSAGANNDALYNAMESSLMKEGFSVRDRTLFKEVFTKTRADDYSSLQNVTDTNLILEVMQIDSTSIYSTHNITLAYKRKQQQATDGIDYRSNGAVIAYRVVMVGGNEIAGSFKYHYAPCVNGCEAGSFTFATRKSQQTSLNQPVPLNVLTAFAEQSIHELSKGLRAE